MTALFLIWAILTLLIVFVFGYLPLKHQPT